MIRVIGAPVDSTGTPGAGSALAPAALRTAGLVAALDATDVGDLPVSISSRDRDPITGVIGWPDVAASQQALRAAVVAALHDGDLPVVVGGCCSLLPGALAGARDALGVVGLAYVDGHLDTFDGRTSPTGEAADMPVSVVLGNGPEEWVDLLAAPIVTTDAIALLGPRDRADVLAGGAVLPEALGASSELDPETLRDLGLERAGRDTERALTTAAENFWVHVDVDVLTSRAMPATDYLQPGGLEWEELEELLLPLTSSAACVGLSIACFNPDKINEKNDTSERVVSLLARLLRE